MLLPIPLILNTLLGILSLLLLGAGVVLLARAYRRYRELVPHFRRQLVPARERHSAGVAVANREDGVDEDLARRRAFSDRSVSVPLAIGLALLIFTFLGGSITRLFYRSGQDEPKQLQGDSVRTVVGASGEKLHVEIFGSAQAPTLVFTHGWSTSSTEWYYAKRQLAGRYRLIFWDLPGLGASIGPADDNYSLERMAGDLHAVLAAAADSQPVVLVGHSIGGMINLTFCKLFPQALGRQVRGIVQVDTSYTNPVTTTKNATESEALQKPVGEPVLHAMVALSPVVRALNWLSYRNGTAHVMNDKSAFAGSETWGQLDLIARYGYESSPSVVARGTLAMFHWDAKDALALIHIPVLILVGQQDTTTLPSASVYMREHLTNAQLKAISPSAHYGLLEKNEQFNSAIARFASASLRP